MLFDISFNLLHSNLDFSFIFLCILAYAIGWTVIIVRHPVYSVFALVQLFVIVALVLAKLNVIFIPLVIVLIYGGAVAILFTFVVITVNIKDESPRSTFISFLATKIFLIFAILDIQIIFLNLKHESSWSYPDFIEKVQEGPNNSFIMDSKLLDVWTLEEVFPFNTLSVLYTEYYIPFIIAGLILLLALIAAIVLTRQHLYQTRSEVTIRQLLRQPNINWTRIEKNYY
ncbi:MAG: hypothetical protein GY739_21485 [Mesoflavibacter sp.]|nr:hypothetical protein [Mesoflavibacter sp.]